LSSSTLPLSPAQQKQQSNSPGVPAAPVIANNTVLAQMVCVLEQAASGAWGCSTLRRLTSLDNAVGLAPGTIVLQLSAITSQPADPAPMPPAYVLTSFVSADEGPTTLSFPAVKGNFSPQLPQVIAVCGWIARDGCASCW
jgi:hypothetical protein